MTIEEQTNLDGMADPKTNPSAKFPKLFLLAGFILGWMVDFLFWGHTPGISIPIWILLALTALLVLAGIERIRPNIRSYGLMALILISTAFTLLRLEPMTFFLNTVAALFGLVLLAATFTHGHWFYYRLIDYIGPTLRVIFGGLQQVFHTLIPASKGKTSSEPGKSGGLKLFFSILRGTLFAIPVLLILGSLLASADHVFAEQLKFMLDWFNIDHLLEYGFRFGYVLVFSLILMGVLFQALLSRQNQDRPDPARKLITPFLGWIETAMMLGSINLMFLLFVTIQFNYLFGGQSNIHQQGFNYAEYAQRGFSELIVVAVLSFFIYLGLESISRRESKAQKRWFSGLSILLMGEVVVILASSFQRLALYEAAYGFTRLRMYTHVFILCLGAFLITMMILEAAGKKGRFALVFMLFCFTFTYALSLTNVDALITKLNLRHSTQIKHSTLTNRTDTLDYDYLRSLSNDAGPELIRGFQNADLPLNTHEKIGVIFACRSYAIHETMPPNWRSYRPMDAYMQEKILSMEGQVSEEFVARKTADGIFVKTEKNDWQCDAYWDVFMD